MGKMIENYSLQTQLGRGVYSTVYKAFNVRTKQQVAIKMVKADKFKQFPKLEEGTYNEINILSNLEPCPHIIKYYDMLKTVNNFYFVYQYCNGGTLQSLLKKSQHLNQKTALNYFSQIVEAFKILNKYNIMHRDLKPQNLLIHDGIIKLADFGFCKPLENEYETTATMLGSPIYMAPQILKGETYTIKADIWSLGVVLFRMLYGFCPFQSNNIGKLIMIIEEEDIKIPEKPAVSPEVVKLLKRMVTKNPKMRADWSEIFAVEIKNGQIIRPLDRSGSNLEKSSNSGGSRLKEGMKNSLTPSQSSTTNTVQNALTNQTPYSSREFGRTSYQIQPDKSDLIYNPRQNALRNTYNAKSPFRENLKKDLLLKNHHKCVEIISLAISLSNFESSDALALGFLLTKSVQKQLLVILDSVRKEAEIRNGDEQMMRTFGALVEEQLTQMKGTMMMFRQELRANEIAVELIQVRKKDYMKRFVGILNKDKIDDLVIAVRVIDYIQEELLIRKQTIDRMPKEKLLSNIRAKVDGVN